MAIDQIEANDSFPNELLKSMDCIIKDVEDDDLADELRYKRKADCPRYYP